MLMPEYSLIQERVTTLCLDLLLKAMALNVLPPEVWCIVLEAPGRLL